MRLFLVFMIIPALWYHASKGSVLERVRLISEAVGDEKGKKW